MNELSRKDWGRFINQFPDVHLLQTTPWGDVKEESGWSVSRVNVGNSGAQILFKPLIFGFCWAYIAKGPVGQPNDEFWKLVAEICKKRRTVFLKIEPDFEEEIKFPHMKFLPENSAKKSIHSIQPRRTLIVDLAGSEDDILMQMKPKTRYNIRLAERKGVKVYSSQDVNRFYGLLQITGQRDEFGIHSGAYYRNVYNAFIAKDLGILLFAEYEGILLSAAMVFFNGKRSWYLYGASSNQHRNLMAPYAIQWEAIRWSRVKGCNQYDLWGVPDEEHVKLEAEFLNRSDGLWGVYRFKRGFGGKLIRSIGAWDVVYNPVLYYFYLQYVKNKKLDV